MLGLEKRIQAAYGDVKAAMPETEPDNDPGDAWHMARLGVLAAVAAILLAGILYVVMDMRVSGERTELEKTLATASERNAAKINEMEKRLESLEKAPAELRAILAAADAFEIARKAERLSDRLETPEQKALAAKITELTNQLETSLKAK